MINFDGANVSECLKYDLLTFRKLIFGGPTGGPNGGLRSQVSALRSQVSGLRSQVSGLRSRVSGLGSQVPGLRSQVFGLRSQVSGLRSLGVFGVSLGLFGCPYRGLWGPQAVSGAWDRQSRSSQTFCSLTGPAQETY